MYCEALLCFWSALPTGKLPSPHISSSLFDWVVEVVRCLSSQQVEIFLAGLWVIWSERNNVVWRGGNYNPFFMAAWVLQHIEEYQRCHPRALKTARRLRSRWECPPSGRLKINVDGSYRVAMGMGGIGVVVRDEFGKCHAAFPRHFPYALSALQMELEAHRAEKF